MWHDASLLSDRGVGGTITTKTSIAYGHWHAIILVMQKSRTNKQTSTNQLLDNKNRAKELENKWTEYYRL